jgi:hypothetical protein
MPWQQNPPPSNNCYQHQPLPAVTFAPLIKLLNMTLFSNWHFMRILRAAVAVWAIFEFTRTNDMLMLAFGGFFAFQAIFDVGCCGSSGCATSSQPHKQVVAAQEVDYEEIK